jgi:hypothetical protein
LQLCEPHTSSQLVVCARGGGLWSSHIAATHCGSQTQRRAGVQARDKRALTVRARTVAVMPLLRMGRSRSWHVVTLIVCVVVIVLPATTSGRSPFAALDDVSVLREYISVPNDGSTRRDDGDTRETFSFSQDGFKMRWLWPTRMLQAECVDTSACSLSIRGSSTSSSSSPSVSCCVDMDC